jgi:hypothetical protein
MSRTSDECMSLSVTSISSSTMSCSIHFLFALIVMLCVWKEKNCVTHLRLWNCVPNLLCSLMNCYVLPDLHTVLLLKVRSITEWKIGYRVFMACIKILYTEFICYSSLWPTVQNVQPNALCHRTERNEMWEYQRYIQSVLNIVAHIYNEYLKKLKYKCGNTHCKNKGH